MPGVRTTTNGSTTPCGAAARSADEQPGRVLVHLVDLLVAEQRREQPGHGEPVLQDVADPGRHPHVVLEDAELALLVADEVDAGHVDADAVGRRDPGDLAAELLAREDEAPGEHAVVEGAAGAVDVGEERLEDPDPLADAARDEVPLGGVDDPRDEVGGHRPFLARVVVGDTAVGEHAGQLVGAVPQLGRVHRLEDRDQRVVGRAGLAGGREHLVPGLGEPVTIENVRHNPQGREPLFHVHFGR